MIGKINPALLIVGCLLIAKVSKMECDEDEDESPSSRAASFRLPVDNTTKRDSSNPKELYPKELITLKGIERIENAIALLKEAAAIFAYECDSVGSQARTTRRPWGKSKREEHQAK